MELHSCRFSVTADSGTGTGNSALIICSINVEFTGWIQDEFVICVGEQSISDFQKYKPQEAVFRKCNFSQLIILVFACLWKLYWALQQDLPGSHDSYGYCTVLTGEPQFSNYAGWETNAVTR